MNVDQKSRALSVGGFELRAGLAVAFGSLGWTMVVRMWTDSTTTSAVAKRRG